MEIAFTMRMVNNVGSKHYWKKGWLGGAYQSFIDAYDVIEESDIHDDEKKTEHDKLLEARKIALGDSYTTFHLGAKPE